MADMHTPLARQVAADTFDRTHGGRMAVSQRMRDGLADDHDMVQCAVAAIAARASQDAETIKALEAQIATKNAALKVALMWSDADWVGHEIVTAALAGSAS